MNPKVEITSKLSTALSWCELFRYLISSRGHNTFNTKEITYAVNLFVFLKKTNLKQLKDGEKFLQQLLRKIRPRISPLKIIRMGPINDAGYSMAKIPNVDLLISGGAGKNIDLEYGFAELGSRVHVFDPNVVILPRTHELIKHHKKFLGHGPKKNSVHDLQTVHKLVGFDKHKINILKIDIEGAELDFLGLKKVDLSGYDQIIIEIHDLYKVVNSNLRKRFSIMFLNLFRFHHVILFNANNNGLLLNFGVVHFPEVFEMTLLNKKYFKLKPKYSREKKNIQGSKNNLNRLAVPNIFKINKI